MRHMRGQLAQRACRYKGANVNLCLSRVVLFQYTVTRAARAPRAWSACEAGLQRQDRECAERYRHPSMQRARSSAAPLLLTHMQHAQREMAMHACFCSVSGWYPRAAADGDWCKHTRDWYMCAALHALQHICRYCFSLSANHPSACTPKTLTAHLLRCCCGYAWYAAYTYLELWLHPVCQPPQHTHQQTFAHLLRC